MPVLASAHPPPPLGLPVAATYVHEGSVMAGLSELTIEHTISLAPPAGGSQSSHPTLPGELLQSGTVTTWFHGQASDPSWMLLLPSHDTVLTGIATGRIAHHSPWDDPQ